MSVLYAIAAQCLHAVLLALAMLAIPGLTSWLTARLSGRRGPPLVQPWFDLVRLLRKERLVTMRTSAVSVHAPVLVFAATAAAAMLVPSFAAGMVLGPLADPVAVLALLALGRVVLAMAAIDDGTAAGALQGRRRLRLTLLLEPSAMLAMLAVLLLTEGGTLDQAVMVRHDDPLMGGAIGGPALVLLAVALLAVVLADAAEQPDAAARGFSGDGAALIQAAAALRTLTWFNLLGVAVVPAALAPPGSGFGAWPLALLFWAVRFLSLTAMLALTRAVFGAAWPFRLPAALGLIAVLCLLAAVMVWAGAGAA